MISLSKMGGYFVGGRQIRVIGRPLRQVSYVPGIPVNYDPNGTYVIEPAYVQYFVPSQPRFQTPLLLIHGGGLTGAQWEDTPDGRPGWLTRLLEARIAVHVIDNVERGRAGWCAIEGEWPDQPVVRSDEESRQFFRFAFPGNQFPIEFAHVLSAQNVPRWASTSVLQAAALVAAIERIGPVVLLGFSQGGGLAMQAAQKQRDLVRACILPEPNGIPGSFAPGVPGTPALMVLGDFIEAHAHSREIMERSRQALSAWERAGGVAEILDLPAAGVRGNTHMMMMDYNSDAVLDLLIAWLDRQHRAGKFD
jgi:pimeloyl-ACP methyl ester carboxylesterase